MSLTFSSNEQVTLEKQVDNSIKPVDTSPDQINNVYEIDKCLQWIRKNHFQKVCIQFPDYLLADSSEVARRLQNELGQTVYVLGDTAYESCCVDYVAAAHVEADAIIHFGPVCFSKPAGTVPCLQIYEKHHLDVDKLKNALLKHSGSTVILDTPYAIYLDKIQQQDVRLITDDFHHTEAPVIIVGNNMRKILNFKLIHRLNDLFCYDPMTSSLKSYDQDPKVIKRRYFLVEKIKDSATFGIVIGTVAVQNYLKVIERVKKLIKVHGKKYYVISVGKPTVAKLANFPEIEVYVVISCGMNEIYDSRDFYKPIVTLYDVEMALNPRWGDLRFSYDFNSYLTESEISREDVDSMGSDVSLISGKIRVSGEKTVVDEIGTEVAVRDDGTVALNSNFGAGFLSQRSWKGLEQKLGDDKPNVVTEGRKGIAQGYTNETL